MKKWVRNWIVIISLIAALLSITSAFTGWFTPKKEIKPGYVCPDGTIVSIPENCPICNEDKICQDKEKCSCEDCEDTVKCIVKRVEKKEYLFLIDDPKKIAGRHVTVKEITKKGSVTIEVEGVIQEIKTTKKEEWIKDLKITTQEIIYNPLSPKNSMVVIKVENI